MKDNNDSDSEPAIPQVDIYLSDNRIGAAAGGGREYRLTDKQVAALQDTLTRLVCGFRPPDTPKTDTGIALDSFEISLGFKVDTSSGSVLKLLLDASAGASISAKVVWKRVK